MSEKEQFYSEFAAKLNGKISDDDLRTVMRVIQEFGGDFDISRKETLPEPYGFPACFKAYLIAKKIEGRSTGTLKNYRMHIADFLVDIGKPLDAVTTDDIRIYLYKYQSIHKIGNRALDAKRLVINGFLQWCADEGYVQKNVCKQVKPIRYEATPREPLTDIEMAFIRRACRSDRDTAIIEMLYSTGCRVSELCRLDKSDVDFQSRAVYLFGKGQKHRTSYMSADAMISLGIYMRDRTDDNAALFIALQRPPRRLTIAGVQWIVRQIGIRSGIGRPLHPHLIRHTMATDALNRGMDITEIQQLLGHEKLETTMIYAKISDESVRQSHRKYVR